MSLKGVLLLLSTKEEGFVAKPGVTVLFMCFCFVVFSHTTEAAIQPKKGSLRSEENVAEQGMPAENSAIILRNNKINYRDKEKIKVGGCAKSSCKDSNKWKENQKIRTKQSYMLNITFNTNSLTFLLLYYSKRRIHY